jgi:hypothetical protein
LSFVNPETIHLHPYNYTGEQWRSTPKGSKNGYEGGIKFVLDVESFDYTLMKKRLSEGFKIAFALPEDKQSLKLDGYLISPGKNNCKYMLYYLKKQLKMYLTFISLFNFKLFTGVYFQGNMH